MSVSNSDSLNRLGRGIFALKSFEPCRRPGVRANGVEPSTANGVKKESNSANKTSIPPPSNIQPAPKPSSNSKQEEKELFAKYSYTANPARPGGFDELSFKQTDRLWFIREHPQNEHWLEARHDNGSVGFVPASYMKVIENKVVGLPWLQKASSESDKLVENSEATNGGDNVFGVPADHKPTFKPYMPSYGTPKVTAAQAENQFYCEICDKQLNGPLPYKAHMTSKYHKEEVEARAMYS